MTPEEVKQTRETLGLTQRGLAEAIGMSQFGRVSVNRWEQGRSKPSRLAVAAMKRLIDERIKEVVGGPTTQAK